MEVCSMRHAALFTFLTLAAVMMAQEAPQTFKFEVKPAKISGSDTYTISKTAEGYRVSGTSEMTSPQGPVTMTYSEDLGTSWDFRQYKFSAKVNGDLQNVDAVRKGDNIALTADVRGQTIPKEVPWKPNTVILDNFIAAHYQVLLNAVAGAKPGTSEWPLVVPQRLSAAVAKLDTKIDNGSGTLDGKQLGVKTYNFELGGSLIRITADQNNRLMRVQVPLQQFEMTREGFVPAAEAPAKTASSCIDSDASFQSGTLKVPATLCTPRNLAAGAHFPVVVMVHGSGPHDRDETIGPNKPFLDIADGLAANGVGSLRYDKRTFFAKDAFTPNSTIADETVDDAVAAMGAAVKLPRVDPKGIYLLGHSLGGMMAPFIAEKAPETHGIILMAAAAVPLDQTIERQLAVQLKATGVPDADVDKQIEQMKQQFASIRSGKTTGTVMVFNAPAHYWADLFQHDTPAELKKLNVPVLVLQAGKDIQVVRADFDLIQSALAGKQAEFKVFPELNHLMMPVDGPSTGAEYGKPGHVDGAVTKTITDWVAKTK
jgi:hypothetical protein